LGNSALFLLVIIAVLGVPFQTVGETCLAFLQGSQGVREIVRANLLISGLGLASAIPLIIFFKLPGAVIHLMLLGAITYISFCWQARSLTVPLRLITVKNLKGIFNSELLKKLVNFGFLRLIQIAIGPVAILVVRSLVIRYQGASQNGIYQAASNFSVFFIPIILNVLWSYSYPGFCRAKTKEELTVEVNQFLRFALLISLPIIILILLVRYPLIRLVYAPTFKLAAAILPLQLLGDFLRVMSIPLGSALVSREMLTAGIKYEFIWNVAFVTAAFSLLPFFSLTVLLVAYVASYLLNFIMLYIHMAYFNGFKLSRRNLAIIVFSILLILVTGFLPLKKIVNFSLFVTIAVFWLSTSLSRMEARALLYRSLGFIKRERV
jgi:PST family polysaccharide transporter